MVQTLSTLNKEDAHIRIVVSRAYGEKSTLLDGDSGWHIDGDGYISAIPNNKILYTLKGSSTLFYPLTTIYDRISRAVRIENFDTNKVFSCKPTSQAAIAIEGMAVHTSPRISEDRLFFWIVPGTTQEIEDLIENE